MKTLVFLVVLGLVGPPVAAGAGERIDESMSAADDGSVTISNLIGSITVEGWNRKEVQVTGQLGDGPERMDFTQDGKKTKIEVVWPKRSQHESKEVTDLIIKLPRGSRVSAEGVNTTIEVTGVEGELDLESINGAITVTGGRGDISAETINGAIEIEATSARVEAESVNGVINVRGIEGELSSATVSGTISVQGGVFDRVDCSSVSGSISLDGEFSREASVDCESHSGTVEIHLPGNISAEFDVGTFSGSIENELGPAAKRKNKYTPGMELRFTTGSGDAEISLNSFSGTIRILKK